MLTLTEAAARLGVSEKTAATLIAATPGAGRKIGRAWRILPSAVDALRVARRRA